jgi:hypothetical protein
MRSRTALAMALDACCVLAFVIIGRASHARGETLGGIASTAWPFLAGMAIGWAMALGLPGSARGPGSLRRPGAGARQGVVVWLATAAAGMVLRVIAGQGTAVAFVGVALAFLGLLLLGWRTLARYITVTISKSD